VLVGHSYGGAIISAAATGNEQIRHSSSSTRADLLVFADAEQTRHR
jgi:hypothetical protein